MTASTQSVLWDATLQLFNLLDNQPALVGVQISPDYPGDQQRAESIWLDGLETVSDVTEFGGPRIIRSEKFDATIMIRVTGKHEDTDTWVRIMQLVNGCAEVLVLYPSLQDYAGVIDAVLTRTRVRVLDTPDGSLGFAELTVSIDTQLS